ncbi:MAG: hypothetical protein QXW35_04315 [Candidatus Aenigmatarchaeota archaeon]
MAISRALVIVVLAFLGFLIIFLIILYFYRIPLKYTSIFNVSKNLQSITSYIFLLNCRKKKANGMSFLTYLILAILVIIAISIIYYMIYKQSISLNIEDLADKIIEENR